MEDGTSSRGLAFSSPDDETPEKKNTIMATLYPKVSCTRWKIGKILKSCFLVALDCNIIVIL